MRSHRSHPAQQVDGFRRMTAKEFSTNTHPHSCRLDFGSFQQPCCASEREVQDFHHERSGILVEFGQSRESGQINGMDQQQRVVVRMSKAPLREYVSVSRICLCAKRSTPVP